MQRLLLEDFLGVAGDHQLLVGSDDQSADLGAPGGDVADIAHGMLVLVGIDADQGMVVIEGRGKVSNFNSLTLAQQVEKLGVRTVVYTDIVCANQIKGPDIINTKELIDHTHLDIIYSGGIASLQDLKNMRNAGVGGVMIGAALYTSKIKLKEAVMLYERGEQVE